MMQVCFPVRRNSVGSVIDNTRKGGNSGWIKKALLGSKSLWVASGCSGSFILQEQNDHSLNSFPLAFVCSTLIFPTVNESTVQNCHTLYIILREMLLYEFSV